MKNKHLKTIFILLIIISTILLLNSKVFAIEPSEVLTDSLIQGADELEQLGGSILGIIMVVGVILAVIILIVIGIKYMTGSVEEKAGYKKTMLPYAIGCIILVGAPAIANVVYEVSDNFAVAQIVTTAYHKNGCGEIEAYCRCNGAQLERCYYCTGCKNIMQITMSEPYCPRCNVYGKK